MCGIYFVSWNNTFQFKLKQPPLASCTHVIVKAELCRPSRKQKVVVKMSVSQTTFCVINLMGDLCRNLQTQMSFSVALRECEYKVCLYLNLQVRINWFSELLQTLVRFRLEVLQDVLKVVFFTKV